MYNIANMPNQIEIGFTGETNFRKVEINMEKWMEEMPEGIPSIVHIRPGESNSDAYIVATTFENNILTWIVTAADLGTLEGVGTAQIWLEEEQNDTIVKRGKSILVATMIHGAINSADDDPPAAQEAWMEQMTALKVTTVNAADVAKNISSHPPRIDENTGNWLVWDQYLGQYVDSGLSSRGQIGAKSFTFILDDVINTSGAYEHSTEISAATSTMKPIALEIGTPSVFGAPITITCNNGSIILSCSNVSGITTAKVIVEETAQSPYEMYVTSEEYAVLDGRIGVLGNLTTAHKDNLVNAVNEVYDMAGSSAVDPYLAKLQEEYIPGTTQIFNYSDGNIQSITHKDTNNIAVRTDVFTFEDNIITEVRTLDTGRKLTIVTNTDTLVTSVTYAMV